MDRFRLSPQQKAFFESFGFLALPGLVRDIAGEIIDAFEEVWSRRPANNGERPDGSRNSQIVPFIDQHERLGALLDDPRIEGLVEELVGEGFNYVGSDGNFFVGDTPWHSDRWLSEVRFVKVAFYLDPVKRDSGSLRLIPGSHRLEDTFSLQLQEAIKQSPEAWGVEGQDVPSLAVETEPGDVVVFMHSLKHASFGGGRRRRMFTINCCQRVPDEHIGILKACISAHVRYGIDRMYDDRMLATAGPRRRTHLEQVLAHQGHMPGELAKLRASS